MTSFEILQKIIVLAEGLAALTGIFYWKEIKNSYWKYFSLYCIIIFLNEVFSLLFLSNHLGFRRYFYDFYAIPIQFIFLFWLYAKQSLKNNNLFTIFIIIYLGSFLPHLFYSKSFSLINSMSYTIACLLLLILCVLEFQKQVTSDDILNFRNNKMFYVNLGVLMFYVGTMPFYSFLSYFYYNHKDIFEIYKFYSISVGILMYILFSASFIWGKLKI